MPDLNEILQDTANYVSWKLDEGEVSAEVSREVLNQLAERTSRDNERTIPGAVNRDENSGSRQKDSGRGGGGAPSAKETLAELGAIASEIAACKACPLHAERTQTVPGQGNPQPEILFVGEAPGKDEDEQGLAFVGRAGQLLTKMIEAMGLSRDEVFIANINKCRPPENRKPTREEMDACLPFLRRQIAVLRPKVIVAMGATAVDGLVPLPADAKISQIRGGWMTFADIPMMPTYHPAYLLRNPAMKRPVWEDLQAVLRHLGRPVPAKRS